MKNPIIFLDFDGVLNSPDTWGLRPLHRALEPLLIERLARLTEAADAQIVISSTWRYYHSADLLASWLFAKGFKAAPARIISETPRMNERRAVEIAYWLRFNAPEAAYVVLDDDSAGDGNFTEVAGHWVKVNPETGLSEDDVQMALEILKGTK